MADDNAGSSTPAKMTLGAICEVLNRERYLYPDDATPDDRLWSWGSPGCLHGPGDRECSYEDGELIARDLLANPWRNSAGMNPKPRYDIALDVRNRLENNFTHHAPWGDQAERYIRNRNACKALAETLCENCPPSRELSLALTALEEAMMWANAAIARNEKPIEFTAVMDLTLVQPLLGLREATECLCGNWPTEGNPHCPVHGGQPRSPRESEECSCFPGQAIDPHCPVHGLHAEPKDRTV